MQNFQFFVPTRILFGEGTRKQIGAEARLFGKRALFVVDPYLREIGLATDITTSLQQDGIDVVQYDQGVTDPLSHLCEEAAMLAKSERCDLVIGMGGGSFMDLAKMSAVLAHYDGSIWDYKAGKNHQPEKNLPFISIPSTAGTGSEVNQYAVITDSETGTKGGIGNVSMFAKVALVDPELTYEIPPKLTGTTGVDAFCHATENLMIKKAFPMSDLIAYEVIRLSSQYLLRAVENGSDREARHYITMASMYAGISNAQTGCAGAHIMGNPLSKYYKIQHGITVGTTIPPFMEFVLEERQEKFAKIAKIMGLDEEMPVLDKARRGIEMIKEFFKKAGIPDGLSEYNVTQEGILKMSKEIENHPGNVFDPKKPSLENYIQIFTKSL